MFRNCNDFLKSSSFSVLFLGFIIGIVSTIIYLGIDLSKLDGLLFVTMILALLTGWYAYITYKILDDQKKSRQIALSEKKLKFYYQLANALNSIIIDENYGETQYIDEKAAALIKTLEDINKCYYLASPRLRKCLKKIVYVYERWTKPSATMEPSKAWEELQELIQKIENLLHKEIIIHTNILNE